ncbi:hypothetical protein [Sphingomonas gilva]|nr:hypothetical protein [Sphingomonas gilva]
MMITAGFRILSAIAALAATTCLALASAPPVVTAATTATVSRSA